MSEEQQQNPYDAVVADLERQRKDLDRQRDEINSAIAMIKRVKELSSSEGRVTVGAPFTPVAPQVVEIQSNAFAGMTIAAAIVKYLGMVKQPKRTAEIARALSAGGLRHGSQNWPATVQSTLSRMKNVVVRVPDGWGLLEWDPNRSAEKKPNRQSSKLSGRKRAAKRAAKRRKKHGRPMASSTASSLQLQGRYLTWLKKVPESKRDGYKAITKREGREEAIKAMMRDFG